MNGLHRNILLTTAIILTLSGYLIILSPAEETDAQIDLGSFEGTTPPENNYYWNSYYSGSFILDTTLEDLEGKRFCIIDGTYVRVSAYNESGTGSTGSNTGLTYEWDEETKIGTVSGILNYYNGGSAGFTIGGVSCGIQAVTDRDPGYTWTGYNGYPYIGTLEHPYTAARFSPTPDEMDDYDVYVALGAPFDIQGHIRTVTLGFGLEVVDGDLVGTVDKVGVITVTAHYRYDATWTIRVVGPSSTVSLVSNGEVIDNITVDNGSTLPTTVPDDLYGYVFKGWYTDPDFQNPFDYTTPIASDMTLYAKWEGILEFTSDPTAVGTVVSISGSPGTVLFNATDSIDYNDVLWDFGDGTTSEDVYVTHYYTEPGTYTATLTVFNNHGSNSAEFIIEVPGSSPGGGGYNALLYVTIAVLALIIGGLVVRRFL